MEKIHTVGTTRPGADCGSDHELFIKKFRLKSRKRRKTTRPARYDTNQSPCGFLDSSESKASACNVGDLGSIPGLGKSLGEGNGNPLQYSCLENPMEPHRVQSMGLQRVRHN